MSDEAKAVREVANSKKTPRVASPEMLAEARAITKNLTWEELVRIASKPKYTGWIVWKGSGIVEQIVMAPSDPDVILARLWKTSSRHAIVHRPSESDYQAVELDPETKRPIPVTT